MSAPEIIATLLPLCAMACAAICLHRRGALWIGLLLGLLLGPVGILLAFLVPPEWGRRQVPRARA
jgi:hypothetical protein